VLAGGLTGAGAAGLAFADSSDLTTGLTAILVVCALGAELIAARYAGRMAFSAAFVAAMMAVGFLGPAPAFAIPALTYVAVWVIERYRWQALLINLAGSATPALFVAIGFQALDPAERSVAFVALLMAATALTMALNVVIVASLMAMLDDESVRRNLRATLGLLPTVVLNCGLVAVIAEIYAEIGLVALAFVGLNVLALTYMVRLVVVARERTREYANLSWGVLSGLVRTLDERDSRAARHCAAVAAFSRDLAE
jgi:hypothetical protein